MRAPVAAGPSLEQALVDEALDDLRGPGLGDPEHAVQRFGRLAGIRREMDEGGWGRAAVPQRVVDRGAHAIAGDEDSSPEEVGQALVA
jgi:hypothetical protein